MGNHLSDSGTPARPKSLREWADHGEAYLKAYVGALTDAVGKTLIASGEYTPGEAQGVCDALTRTLAGHLAGPLDDPASASPSESSSESPSTAPASLVRSHLDTSRTLASVAKALSHGAAHVARLGERWKGTVPAFAQEAAEALLHMADEAMEESEQIADAVETLYGKGIPEGDLTVMVGLPGEGPPTAQGAQPVAPTPEGDDPVAAWRKTRERFLARKAERRAEADFNPKRDVAEVRALLALADSLFKGSGKFSMADALEWEKSAKYWVGEYAKIVRRWETEGVEAKWWALLTKAAKELDGLGGQEGAAGFKAAVQKAGGADPADDDQCPDCLGTGGVNESDPDDDDQIIGGCDRCGGTGRLPTGLVLESGDDDPMGRIDRMDAMGVGAASPSRLPAAYYDLADSCAAAHPDKAKDFRAMADDMAAGLTPRHRAELDRAGCDCAALGDGMGLQVDCAVCRPAPEADAPPLLRALDADDELDGAGGGEAGAGFKGSVLKVGPPHPATDRHRVCRRCREALCLDCHRLFDAALAEGGVPSGVRVLLDHIRQCADKPLPHYPKRIADMTDDELAIHRVGSEAVGGLLFCGERALAALRMLERADRVPGAVEAALAAADCDDCEGCVRCETVADIRATLADGGA